MSDPTHMPFQEDSSADDVAADSVHEGQRPVSPASPDQPPAATGPGRATTDLGQLAEPEETETDRLAARVSGPEDHEGMTALWRATMDLPHWWFIAVGDPGAESPAAAQIEGQLMLLTFTSAERARHFAVQNGMVAPDEDLRAIALPPEEVVDAAEAYQSADVTGLMFDPHLTGYFIPCEQMPVVWDALRRAS